MLALFGSKIIMYLVLGGILVSVLVGGYFYWQHIIQENAILKNNQKVLEQGIQTQRDAIINMQEEVAEVKLQNEQVTQKNEAIFNDTLRLQEKLNKRLDLLAVKKPGLIEKRINKGTSDSNRCLEIASGSPLTEVEKNANRKSQFNTICPSIANPLSIN